MVWNPSSVLLQVGSFELGWYPALFGLGFLLALLVGISFFKRLCSLHPEYKPADVKDWVGLQGVLGCQKSEVIERMNLALECKEEEEEAGKGLVRFGRRCMDEMGVKRLKNRLYFDGCLRGMVAGISERSCFLAEIAWVYVLVGGYLGAHVFDALFYGGDLFHFGWGMSSHGAFVGALFAVLLWFISFKRMLPRISFWNYVDVGVVPTLIVCGLIRLGNFFNMEILGKATHVPWGVVFGEEGLMRHPVQLYEAVWYLGSAALFGVLFLKHGPGMRAGRFAGLALLVTSLFRFGMEFLKVEGELVGQMLTLPFLVLGLLLIRRRHVVLGS